MSNSYFQGSAGCNLQPEMLPGPQTGQTGQVRRGQDIFSLPPRRRECESSGLQPSRRWRDRGRGTALAPPRLAARTLHSLPPPSLELRRTQPLKLRRRQRAARAGGALQWWLLRVVVGTSMTSALCHRFLFLTTSKKAVCNAGGATPQGGAHALRSATPRARIPSSHPPPRSPPHANPLLARLVSFMGASLRVALGERDEGKGERSVEQFCVCALRSRGVVAGACELVHGSRHVVCPKFWQLGLELGL